MAKQPVGGSEPAASYSPGIIAEGRFVYVSGQGSFRDGALTGTGIEEQTKITLGNLAAVLGSAAAGQDYRGRDLPAARDAGRNRLRGGAPQYWLTGPGPPVSPAAASAGAHVHPARAVSHPAGARPHRL